VFGQTPDPAYEPLARAYEALRSRDYDASIAGFLQAVEASPQRASIRKDLGYAYLKTGENELARDQFQIAMEMDPGDTQVAMEYAFLAYETKQRQQARRIFDRVRKSGEEPFVATAEQAFQNVDAPLAAGIERWTKAIEMGADNFSVHFDLATLAEERDELGLAATHYEKAWRLKPDQRSVLLDLGRVWKELGRTEDSQAALLAASRGGEPRAAESARELLPARYPYVSEFRRALQLDPANSELRRDLGFLLLEMDFEDEAEPEFQVLVRAAPDDLLAATQLGFLLNARGETDAATPLFDRVMAGNDLDLANRVRAVLRLDQVAAHDEPQPVAIDAKEMAERSIKAGYMQDAVKYLLMANDADPGDCAVMLRLGWTYNILHLDSEAIRWFDLARASSDPQMAREAASAYRNLRASDAGFHITAWLYPVFSSRWSDTFGYGQIKAEFASHWPVRPYLSLRLIGDTRGAIGAVAPIYLSESSVIPGIGVKTVVWRHAMAWAEAGLAIGYLRGHVVPDYRAGISFSRGAGHLMGAESPGWYAETNLDAVFVSQFGNDSLVYGQVRSGYTVGQKLVRAQFYWNSNLTFDQKRQAWANFLEIGPGVKLTGPMLPKSAFIAFNALHGWYLVGPATAFTDLRVGFWYAFTR
jgi:Flp pilus assembly protein TadD